MKNTIAKNVPALQAFNLMKLISTLDNKSLISSQDQKYCYEKADRMLLIAKQNNLDLNKFKDYFKAEELIEMQTYFN